MNPPCFCHAWQVICDQGDHRCMAKNNTVELYTYGHIFLADSSYIDSCFNLSTKATSLSPKGGHFGRVQRKWNGEYDFVHKRRKMADMAYGEIRKLKQKLKQFVVVSVCICGNVFPLYSNLRSGSIFVSL